jgi:phosphoribosylanthranilate isomerase
MGSREEARLAIHYGASAVGLVSEMPSGPGVIPEETISSIASMVPPGVATFLLTSKQDAKSIISQQRRCRTNTIQIVDRVAPEVYGELRQALPGVKLVQVIHVRDEESRGEAESVEAFVDAVLLDSGNPTLPVKELGGTGRVHNWDISRRIREALNIPIFLAGGLNAGNVAQAINEVDPFAVDVCSGVRTRGLLNEAKVSAFFDAVNSTTQNQRP